MTQLEHLINQIDDKVAQLKDSVILGNLDHVQYQRLCGEIRGLLIARGYILDLKERLENSDE